MDLELQIDEQLKSMQDMPLTPLSYQLEYNTSLKFGSAKSPDATPKRDLEKVQEATKNDVAEEDSASEQESSGDEYESDDALNFRQPRFADATMALHA